MLLHVPHAYRSDTNIRGIVLKFVHVVVVDSPNFRHQTAETKSPRGWLALSASLTLARKVAVVGAPVLIEVVTGVTAEALFPVLHGHDLVPVQAAVRSADLKRGREEASKRRTHKTHLSDNAAGHLLGA